MIQSIQLDASEARVLDVAEEVGYGEIYNVELQRPNAASVRREVTDEQRKFLEMVRNQGITFITKLTIHNRLPSVVEIEGESRGLAYRRKLKI